MKLTKVVRLTKQLSHSQRAYEAMLKEMAKKELWFPLGCDEGVKRGLPKWIAIYVSTACRLLNNFCCEVSLFCDISYVTYQLCLWNHSTFLWHQEITGTRSFDSLGWHPAHCVGARRLKGLGQSDALVCCKLFRL